MRAQRLVRIAGMLAITLTPFGAAAQTPTPAPPKIEFSGFVDAYYSYNFNKPSTGLAQVRNFDVRHNAFSLNLAEFAVEMKPTADSRGGFRVDLDYGHQAEMVNASDPAGAALANVGQAYVSYLTPNGVQLDFGKFYSPIGYEGIKTKDNWNYSRSLIYALAEPYYHAGLRANYTVNEHVAVAGFLVNGWNNVVDNNAGKTIGGQITLKPSSSITLVEAYMGGPEQSGDNGHWRHISDTILTYSATPAVTLAANYDYGRESSATSAVVWQGVAGYVRYQPNAWFAITPRADYYDDRDGVTTGIVQKITAMTLTTEFKDASGFSTRIEYRRDMSNRAFFQQRTSVPLKHQDTLSVAVIYVFSK